MQSFRLFGGVRRAAEPPAVPHAPADDTATVDAYIHDITQACIDLIDLPHEHDVQQRVIQVLLHQAPLAEQAMARLEKRATANL
jgi:hypothetical protein